MTALVYVVAVTAALLVNDAFPTSRVIMPVLMAGLATTIAFILNLAHFTRILGIINSFQALTSLPTLDLIEQHRHFAYLLGHVRIGKQIPPETGPTLT